MAFCNALFLTNKCFNEPTHSDNFAEHCNTHLVAMQSAFPESVPGETF